MRIELYLILALVGSGAQPPERKVETSDKDQARELFQQGRQYADKHRWADALEAFASSYKMMQSPLTLFNIGYCQRALGRLLDARSTFTRFLEVAKESAAAETAVDEVKRLLLEIDARVGRVSIELRQPEVRIGIDGRSIDATASPIVVEVDPGFHSVGAERSGYRPFFRDLQVAAGDRLDVSVVLVPLPVKLLIESTVQEASVMLDGKQVGHAPFKTSVDPGSHEVEVVAAGYLSYKTTVKLEAGSDGVISAVLLPAPLPPDPPPLPPWLFWSTTAASVSSLAVASVFAIRMKDAESSYRSLGAGSDEIDGGSLADLGDDASSRGTAANVFFAIAGGLAVAAGVEALFTDW